MTTPLALGIYQLEALSGDKTLVLLHPANYQANRQLAYHVLDGNRSAYLQIQEDHDDLKRFLRALEAVLKDAGALKEDKLSRSAKKAAQQVADNLNQGKGFTLFLESYDQVVDEGIHEFVSELAKTLKSGRRVLIGSRRVPTELLQQFDDPDRCAMIPNAPDQMLVDYVASPPDTSLLEVHALGPGQAFIDGRPLTHWDGVLPKCLFYFLVDRAMTTRDEIFDTFWHSLDKKEATNVFHVTKRKVSEILGKDLTTYGSSFYRISDQIELHYDVVVFQEAVQNAEVAEDDDDAMALYQQAIRMYRGHFLSTLDQDWVVRRREELAQTYTEALTGLARIHEDRSESLQALGLYQRAFACMPQREDLTRKIMELYADRSQADRALEVFRRLTETLANDLNVEPGPETVKLAKKLEKAMK
jgi:DNA-binding SARP family transcriptional activator